MSTRKELFVLSGGAGTRLWPFSRQSFPKQFFDLTRSGKPLLVESLERLKGHGELNILTTELLRFPSMGILKKFSFEAEIYSEPAIRNTGPAVLLAALIAHWKDPKSLVGVFPADHVVRNREVFAKALEAAFQEAAQGKVVTLGIQPTYPATAYGYMELESTAPAAASKLSALGVKRFLEKPTEDKAKELLATGKVVWNAGIFVFPAARMIELFKEHLPELSKHFEGLKKDLSNLEEIYPKVEAVSVDVGIMEKLTDLRCIPVEMGWSDVGSWEEVAKLAEERGVGKEVEAQGNFYENLMDNGTGTRKLTAFVGVSDLLVLDTPDALLVAQKGSGQKVKDAVAALREKHAKLLTDHCFESRPWGKFEIISEAEHFKSKKITVWPGQKLSYQSHKHRAEHWVITKGQAQVTLNDELIDLKAGEHVHIPVGAKHRIANPGTEPMEFIEVQTGSYFGEDDITRYSDDYGRK